MPVLRDEGGSSPPPPVSPIGITLPPPAPPTAIAVVGTAPTTSSTPTPGQGISLDSAGRLSSSLPIAGSELDYVQSTGTASVTATTATGATTVLTSDATGFDGHPVIIQFFAPNVVVNANAAGNFLIYVLFEDTVLISQLGDHGSTSNIYLEDYVNVCKRHTPSKGLHTYSVRAYRTNANCTINAGDGTAGNRVPMFLRITRV